MFLFVLDHCNTSQDCIWLIQFIWNWSHPSWILESIFSCISLHLNLVQYREAGYGTLINVVRVSFSDIVSAFKYFLCVWHLALNDCFFNLLFCSFCASSVVFLVCYFLPTKCTCLSLVYLLRTLFIDGVLKDMPESVSVMNQNWSSFLTEKP